jgi:hypothetical protein
MTDTPPKKGRPSQRPTSPERKSNAGRPPGRKYTDNLHVPLQPEDRAVVEWLKARRNTDASSLVRMLLHAEKLRIEGVDAASKGNNAET